jgi:hypothetical protein
MHDSSHRRLYWVPIIHTPEDLGSVRESVRRHYIQKIGKGEWDRQGAFHCCRLMRQPSWSS